MLTNSDFLLLLANRIDGVGLLAAGCVSKQWRAEMPSPTAQEPFLARASLVTAWVLEKDAELIELEQAERAMRMYRLALQLRRGQVSEPRARELRTHLLGAGGTEPLAKLVAAGSGTVVYSDFFEQSQR